MSKEIKDEEVDKLLEDELFREAKMIEKSLLGDHADEPSVSDEEIDKAIFYIEKLFESLNL